MEAFAADNKRTVKTTCLLLQKTQGTAVQLKPLQSMEINFAKCKRIGRYNTQALNTEIFFNREPFLLYARTKVRQLISRHACMLGEQT